MELRLFCIKPSMFNLVMDTVPVDGLPSIARCPGFMAEWLRTKYIYVFMYIYGTSTWRVKIGSLAPDYSCSISNGVTIVLH